MQHICTIQSLVVTKYKGPIIIEDGYFELEVLVDMEEATKSGDPKGYVQKEIVAHLMKCKIDTDIPLHEKLWSVEFTLWAQAHLEYPEGFVI